MTPTLSRIISTIRQRRPGVLDVYFGADDGRARTEHEFFDSLRMPNGTAKTSADRRLDDLNALVAPLLPADRPIAIMDVAAGSGISSLEWVDQLRASGRQPEMLAGDLHAWGWLTTLGSKCAVLYLDGGKPLMFEFRGRILSLSSNRFIVRALRQASSALFRMHGRVNPAAPMAAPRRWRLIHRRIPLISPRLIRRGEPQIVVDDLARPGAFSQRFDVVRAANILNLAYFDRAALSILVANVIDRVRHGGLLAVCRTASDGVNHTTVFRRMADSMTVQARLGGGSEVEDLVLAWRSERTTLNQNAVGPPRTGVRGESTF